MTGIPAAYHDLFEKPTLLHLATLDADGAPHVTPVWVDYDADAERLLVNTERGRRKERNVDRDPRVGGSMVDPDDPYRRVGFQGAVDAVTEDGARDHIDTLARRYTGDDYDPDQIETRRVILRIRVDETF